MRLVLHRTMGGNYRGRCDLSKIIIKNFLKIRAISRQTSKPCTGVSSISGNEGLRSCSLEAKPEMEILVQVIY